MKVRVKDEIASPRMHDAGDADQRADPFAIQSELKNRFTGRLEQQVEKQALVFANKRAQFCGQGEDDMEVAHGQRALHAPGDPASLFERLTLGTVAIATRIVDQALLATGCTYVAMAAERARAADRDVPQRPALHGAERVRLPKGPPVLAEYSSDITGRRSPPPGRTGGRLVVRRLHRSARWLWVFCLSSSQRGARTRRADHVAFAVAQSIERTRHASQVLLRHLQIPCRVSDRLMPQQNLDGAQVFARLQKMRGEGMPERVDGHTTGDAELGRGAVDSATDGIRAELLARVLPRKQQRPRRFGQPPVVAQHFAGVARDFVPNGLAIVSTPSM